MSEVKICPTCGSEYPVSERFCPRDGSALRGDNPVGDLTGTVIAERYHVIKKLGEGGMGTVYLAEHVKMGRKSALKVMNPGMAENADAIARFNREASNASRLNHPNICAIYDFGETHDGLIYLAMEFIEGESLTSIIERSGALPPPRAASILHQAADGLQVAHDYGIVHRDLKPDNIMIAKGRDNSDLVKVVDFGIAKAHTSDAQKVTKTGLVVGTPEYMSPEQLSGDKLDGRSDIYSLALVGFNMLTGTLPFPSKSAQEAMIMRLTDKPKTLADMRPEVAWPEALQAVMDKALARDVNERYQKASDFGREFSMAIEAMPATVLAEAGTQVIGAQAVSPNAPTAAIPRTRVASDAEKGLATPGLVATPVAKKGKGMMIGVAAVLVIALGLGGAKLAGLFPQTSAAGAPGDTSAIANAAKQDSSLKGGASPKTVPPTTDRGKQGETKQGAGQAPAQSNPPTTAGNAGTTPTVASLLTKYDALDYDNMEKTAAEAELGRLQPLFERADLTERTRIYYYRAQLMYVLDDTTAFCSNRKKALDGTGLKEFQRIQITALGPAFKCN